MEVEASGACGGGTGAGRTAGRRTIAGVVRSVDGYVPSIVAIGCTRAWLSMQTGLIDAYETQVLLDPAYDWVQNAVLMCASLLFALMPLGARFARYRAPLMAVCGVFGAALYAGTLYLPWGPHTTALAAGLLVACLCWFIRVWCEDNCSDDLGAVLTRLGASFVVQYIVYTVVVLVPSSVQGVCAWGTPLLIAACLGKKPLSATEGERSDGAHGCTVGLKAPDVVILAAVVALCCAAHGLLFNFSSTVSGVWILGSFMVGALSLAVAAGGGTGPLLKRLVCATVAMQCAGAVLSMAFPGNLDWISLAKSISYTASMMLAFSIGCLVGSLGRGSRSGGRVAALWVSLFFVAVCAAFYGGRVFARDSSALLIAVLVLLVASAVLMLGRDWNCGPVIAPPADDPRDADSRADTDGGAACGQAHRDPSFDQVVLRSGLTPQELGVLNHLLEGKSVRQAAELNGVSVNTVRSQVQAVYRKLGVHSREELLALAAPGAPDAPGAPPSSGAAPGGKSKTSAPGV